MWEIGILWIGSALGSRVRLGPELLGCRTYDRSRADPWPVGAGHEDEERSQDSREQDQGHTRVKRQLKQGPVSQSAGWRRDEECGGTGRGGAGRLRYSHVDGGVTTAAITVS